MRARSGRVQPTVLLAGWLFADLAVGLVIILLATATDAPMASPAPSPSPTPSIEPTPSPTAEPLVNQLAVEQEPVTLRVQSEASALLRGDRDEISRVAGEIEGQLEELEEAGRKAAFVLTFGGSPDTGEGVALAQAANEILIDAAPQLSEGAAMRDFWRSVRADEIGRGTLLFEIYLFVSGDQE